MSRDAMKAELDALLPTLKLAHNRVGPWRTLNPGGYFVVPRTERYSVWFDESADIDEQAVAILLNAAAPRTPE